MNGNKQNGFGKELCIRAIPPVSIMGAGFLDNGVKIFCLSMPWLNR